MKNNNTAANEKSISKTLKIIVSIIFSPTWFIAYLLKGKDDDKERRKNIIWRFNTLYFKISIISVISIFFYDIIFQYKTIYPTSQNLLKFLWIWFLLSRSNEIFYAFIKDAIDKTRRESISKSSLEYSERIVLALKSYLELIINFGIIYWLLPSNYFGICRYPNNIIDTLYYSGVTITTLGYGDISPAHWATKFLSVYEVLCGFILLIVSFTIYTNRANNQNNGQQDK